MVTIRESIAEASAAAVAGASHALRKHDGSLDPECEVCVNLAATAGIDLTYRRPTE